MRQVACESVSRGMRAEERTVCIRDAVSGQRSFIRVEADFLTAQEGKYYLPVGVIQEEPERALVLIELTHEPDAGNTRLWVRRTDLLEPGTVPA